MSKEYKWESPIKVDYADFDITKGLLDDVSRKITDGVDGIIIKGCVNVGVNVDKYELIRALDYDREQYKKGFDDGYENGKRDALPKLGEWETESARNCLYRCSSCQYISLNGKTNYCPRCGAKMGEQNEQ